MLKNIKPLLNHKITHYFIFLLLVTITYAFSVDVPFYLDDFRSIRENNLLIIGTMADFLWQNRFIGTLTFFFQYQLGFAELQHLHIVNIVIHFFNTVLVYVLVRQLICLCVPQQQDLYHYLPLVVAACFAVHPLNTQPVVYLVQRYTLLSAFFYLSATSLYIFARNKLSSHQLGHAAVGICAVFACLFLGWYSKQNMISIFVVFYLLEILYFSKKKLFKPTGYLFFSGIFLAFTGYMLGFFESTLWQAIDSASRETPDVSRLDYFLAQLNILWIYIYKFVLPIDLRLEYSIFENHFSIFTTGLAAVAHIAVLTIAVKLYKKYPIVTFAILFYYAAHLVESSIIPIRDFAFEHRTYLPNFALCLILGVLFIHIKNKLHSQKIVAAAMIGIICCMSFLSIERVTLWQNKMAFFENEYNYNPSNIRVLLALAKVKRENGEKQYHDKLIRAAYELSGDNIRDDVLGNYLAMLIENRYVKQANAVAKKSLPQINDVKTKNQILHNLGVLNFQLNDYKLAKNYFSRAIAHPPMLPDSFYNLAIIALKEKQLLKAEQILAQLLAKYPSHSDAIKLMNTIQTAKVKFGIKR